MENRETLKLKHLFSYKQYSDMVGIHVSSVYRRRDTGKIEEIVIGDVRLIYDENYSHGDTK